MMMMIMLLDSYIASLYKFKKKKEYRNAEPRDPKGIIIVKLVTQIHSMNNGVHDPSGKGGIYICIVVIVKGNKTKRSDLMTERWSFSLIDSL